MRDHRKPSIRKEDITYILQVNLAIILMMINNNFCDKKGCAQSTVFACARTNQQAFFTCYMAYPLNWIWVI